MGCSFFHANSAALERDIALSLIIMLDEIRKNLDEKNISGMLLTDLSKAFDCHVHDLMRAKLQAYGSEYNALRLVNLPLRQKTAN